MASVSANCMQSQRVVGRWQPYLKSGYRPRVENLGSQRHSGAAGAEGRSSICCRPSAAEEDAERHLRIVNPARTRAGAAHPTKRGVDGDRG